MKPFNGKTAMITDAARGIRSALAEARVAEAAGVALAADIDIAWGCQSAGEAGPTDIAAGIDIARQDIIGAGPANSMAAVVSIDILINNATIFALAPIVETARDGCAQVFDTFIARHEGRRRGQKRKEVGASVPCGRMGRAEDLSGRAIFLASDEAACIVAQTCNAVGVQRMS